MRLGYTLSSEEFDAPSLVAQAERAEQAGFAFASISDHFHPWIEEQGESPFVWGTLGAISQRTERIEKSERRQQAPAELTQARRQCPLLARSQSKFRLEETARALNSVTFKHAEQLLRAMPDKQAAERQTQNQ